MRDEQGLKIAASIFGCLFIFFACSPKMQVSFGGEREVIIIYDQELKAEVNKLQEFLQDTFFTPHLEELFTIFPMLPEQFSPALGYKNVFLLVNTPPAFSPRLQLVLQNKPSGLYKTYDVFTKGDMFLILNLPKEGIVNRFKERIKQELLDRLYSFYKTKEYFTGSNKKLQEAVGKEYGFTFDFPRGWAYVYKEFNFLAFARHWPDRFFFVYQENLSRTLDPEELVELRNTLGKKYYEGDYIDTSHLRVEKIKFLDQDALKVQGIWQNKDKIRGGPFTFYAFNRGGKFYLVDIGVYAPERQDKLEFLLRTEVIIKSLTWEK